MLVQEAMGYTRHGLRCVSAEEMEARRKFVMKVDFSKPLPKPKPLSAYDDGKRTLDERVAARYQEEKLQLTEKYQDFFKFPETREFQQYEKRMRRLDHDYQEQKKAVLEYHATERQIKSDGRKGVLGVLGTIAFMTGCYHAQQTTTSNPLVSFFIMGAVWSLVEAGISFTSCRFLKKFNQERLEVLEHWHNSGYLQKKAQSIQTEHQKQK